MRYWVVAAGDDGGGGGCGRWGWAGQGRGHAATRPPRSLTGCRCVCVHPAAASRAQGWECTSALHGRRQRNSPLFRFFSCYTSCQCFFFNFFYFFIFLCASFIFCTYVMAALSVDILNDEHYLSKSVTNHLRQSSFFNLTTFDAANIKYLSKIDVIIEQR